MLCDTKNAILSKINLKILDFPVGQKGHVEDEFGVVALLATILGPLSPL